MFRIKICGITTPEDAAAAARAGADAVGLNFYANSPRCVDPDVAREIAEVVPPGVVKVGVFVNAPAAEIVAVVEQVGLDAVQLHGDEPPEVIAELAGRPVVRAFRLAKGGLATIAEYLERCRRVAALPAMSLVDAHVKGEFGGTGVVADWHAAANYSAEPWYPPLILAGGLGPDNVAQAIELVRPRAVDTASGVESSPGRKAPRLVSSFVRAARAGFDSL